MSFSLTSMFRVMTFSNLAIHSYISVRLGEQLMDEFVYERTRKLNEGTISADKFLCAQKR